MDNLRINKMKEYLIYQTEALCAITDELRLENIKVERSINQKVIENLLVFSEKTDYSEEDVLKHINETLEIKENTAKELKSHAVNEAAFDNVKDLSKIMNFKANEGENRDIASVKELILKGNIGIASFISSANSQGYDDEEISSFMQFSLSKLLDSEVKIDELFAISIKIGEFGIRAMQLLDYANSKTFGNVTRTEVNFSGEKSKAVLAAGDNLMDLKDLLEQCENSETDVYTYGEMISAHSYDEFRKFSSLKGHYGAKFNNQREAFRNFKGNILLTSGPLEEQDEETLGRIYTSNSVNYPGAEYIGGGIGIKKDFEEFIRTSESIEGFTGKNIITGYAHHELFEHMDEIIAGLNTKNIKKFYVILGNGSKSADYYTEMLSHMGDDILVLTAGNVKFGFMGKSDRTVNGLPQILDAGQLSDSYSIIFLMMKLATTLGLSDVNDLPVVYNIAWDDEKSAALFLSLIALGIRNIVFSPSIPEFLTENVAGILSEQFKLKSISSVEEDVEKYIVKESNDIMDIPMGELVLKYPQLVNVLMDMGMHCIGCPSSHMETIEEAALVHGLDVKEVERKLREKL